MLAVAAIALVACNKNVEPELVQEEVTHVATVTLNKLIDTKTAIDEGTNSASYVWTDGDEAYLNIYECYTTIVEEDGVEVEKKNYNKGTINNIAYSPDYKTATLTVSFTGSPTGPYSYEAIYAKSVSNKFNPSIQANQQPKADSFDPSADVMISKATADITGVNERLTSFQFTMGRVVTVNKMTLTGLDNEEKVKKVEFSLDKNMVGTYAINTGSYSAGGKKLILDYTEEGQAVANDGSFPVYFVSAPVDAASIVSVVVTTDKNVYTKSNALDPNPFAGKTITFAVGKMTRFTMAMSGYGEPVSKGTVYTLVESNDDLFDGATYIIAAADEDVVMGLYTGGNNHPKVEVEKSKDATGNSIITVDNTMSFEPIVISAHGDNWYMTNAASGNTYEGQYLICATGDSNNHLKETDSEENGFRDWTISINDGVALIINANNAAIRNRIYYNSQNSGMFASYKEQSASNYHSVALYVDKSTCVELADPELSFNVVDLIEVDWDDTENFTAPTLNNPHDLSVSYSSSEPAVATVDATSGEIVFVGNGETVITAKSAKTSDYKAGEATYTLCVKGKVDFKSIAELNALATTTATMWDGRLENAIVSFVPDLNSAVIKDETGSILVYIYDKNDSEKVHGLKQGQTFSGYFMPTVKLYNGTAEIIDLDEAIFEGEGAVVEPESFTLATLVGNLTKYQNAYVQVTGLSVTNVSGQNLSVSNGDYSYMVYVPKDCPIVAGDIITVTGTVAHYGDNDQIKVWNLDDIEKTGHVIVTPSISFSQPSQGGSFTVVVDGAEITSGAAVQEGKTVTLTATAADGYTFNGWTVTGATLSGNTATETFIVGTTDVTIAAAFKSNSSPSLDPEEIDFTAQGYTNQQEISSASAGHFSVSFDKGSNSNAPKYYTTGTAIRAYGGNKFTVSSEYTISKIEITFGSGEGTNAITTNVVTYENGTWTGSANSVVFTIGGTSGHRRIQKIKVTY